MSLLKFWLKLNSRGPLYVAYPVLFVGACIKSRFKRIDAVSYTHLRAHETVLDLVCRLLLEKKKHNKKKQKQNKKKKKEQATTHYFFIY